MGLLVWLPLNGNLENWGSSPAKFDWANSNNGLQVISPGKTSTNCYQRSSANTADYITSDINFSFSGDMSIACWCKLTGSGTTDSANGIITHHGHLTGGLGITMRYVSTNDYRMSVNSGLYGDAGGGTNDRTYCTYYGNTNIYNSWHHLCVTYNATTKQIRLYVDGKLDRDPINVAGNNSGARPFRLFDWSTDHSTVPAYRPPCFLNDVRLYDNCLSSKEVKLLAQGLIAHYKLDHGGQNNLLVNTYNPSSTSDLVSVPSTCSIVADPTKGINVFQSSTTATSETYIYTSRTQVIKPSTQYTFSCDMWVNDYVNSTEFFWLSDTAGNPKSGAGYVNVTNQSQTIQKRNDWFHLEWTFTTKSNDRTGYIRIDNNGSKSSGTAAIMRITNVKLEEGSKATSFSLNTTEANFAFGDDCSGFGNHLTQSGIIQFAGGSIRYNDGCDFNQTGYLYKNDFNIKATQWTINFWTKVPATTVSQHFTLGTFTNWTGNGFGYYTDSGTSYNIIWRSEGESIYKGSPAVKFTPNAWTMVTFVATGTECITYLNGVEYNRITYGNNGLTNHPCIILGNSKYSNTPASETSEDKMSDFRFYVSALTEEDIKILYNTVGSVTKSGALIAYDFNEHIQDRAKINKNGTFIADFFGEKGQFGGMKITTLDNGTSWARIFYHNNHGGTVLFKTYDEILYTTTADKYSRLQWLTDLVAVDGKYEFMLTYPEKYPNKYNRWKQSMSPLVTWLGNSNPTGTVPGYEAIHTDWTANYWGGIGRQHEGTTTITSTFLDGSVGHQNWFYAIGATSPHDGGVPGPDCGVQETELWIRIDTLPNNTTMKILKERFVSASLLQEI